LGVAVLIYLPDLEVAQVAQAICKITFPYIPGLLAFREAPCVLEAISRVGTTPDLVIVDGHGLAHPRRFGLACHVGVLTGLPTIGCARSILIGTHGPVGTGKGAWVAVKDGDEVIGASLRTRDRVKPVYVSIGHKVDLPSAIRWTLACCGKYRLPEPLRIARKSAREKMRLL
jgi:deoxyribonuclease V